MKNKLVIGKVYHNRCVLLDTEHLAQAGISKNDYVTLRAVGDAITIRKARIVDGEKSDGAKMDYLLGLIRSMNPDQISMVQRAVAHQMDSLNHESQN